MVDSSQMVLGLAGGILCGVAVVAHMGLHGRIAGMSGIFGNLLSMSDGNGFRDALAVFTGLVAAPLLYNMVSGSTYAPSIPHDPVRMGVAGLLVGFGVYTGSGCTSGHGVCGVALLSPRSILATIVFGTTGMITVFLLRHM